MCITGNRGGKMKIIKLLDVKCPKCTKPIMWNKKGEKPLFGYMNHTITKNIL